MSIRRTRHARVWDRMLTRLGPLDSPVLLFGYQEIDVPAMSLRADRLAATWRWVTTGSAAPLPAEYRERDLGSLLRRRGTGSATTLDLFDERADVCHDMNYPLPAHEMGRYGALIDIGSLEHVFDTRQCLENCFRALKIGGWYLAHVPVNGYFAHGLHVFNPEAIFGALSGNGFRVDTVAYTTHTGRPVRRPAGRGHRLLWVTAQKVAETDNFVPPQQGYWTEFYAATSRSAQVSIQKQYWSAVGGQTPTVPRLER